MLLNPDITRPREKARPIFESLRREILSGRFAVGEKLPGSRALARQLGVARGTINLALAMLAAEGLVEIRPASGVIVVFSAKPPGGVKLLRTPRFSRWASRLPPPSAERERPFFETGRLADSYFPERDWLQAIKAGRRNFGVLSSQVEQSVAGYAGLRKMIAAHLNYSRGLRVDPENIAVVNGSMQAIALITQLLLDPQDTAAFEDPGFHGIRSAIQATGAKSLPLPVDAEGMAIPIEAVRLLVVTPASQFPTGVMMSQQRRAELLTYAQRHNAFVIEDEYDSEFTRFANAPQPLKLTDAGDRVIYVGSFSRTMFASLRLGYCVLPDALVDPFLRARQLYDSVPPALSDQLAMAGFMQAGRYRLHLKRMNKLYAARHDLLLAGLERTLGSSFSFRASAAGLSIYAKWHGSRNEFAALQNKFEDDGIAWQSVARYFARKPETAALFGFSHLSESEIHATLGKISRVVSGV